MWRPSIWSIIYAGIAGVDLGYALDYFIHKSEVGTGIVWLVLAILMTIFSISHFKRPVVYIEASEDEEQ